MEVNMRLLSERLQELGLTLPEVPKAVASYVPAVITSSWCFTSGQLPFLNGQLVAQGIVGKEVGMELAQKAARQSALNALSAAAAAAGDLDRISGVIKVVGFVQCLPDFHGQPEVINGASWLFEEIFQEAGHHARSAVGTNALPMNASVEVECIFVLRG
jgi:enamine deaminase RidA (YjgF/YER057c/UK114 family)